MASTVQSPFRIAELATWAANFTYNDIPKEVEERTKELFLDWLACCIAGRHHPAVTAIAKFAEQMGPSASDGKGSEKKSEYVDENLRKSGTSPAFAALVNASASHVVEQDDLHNKSIVHPGTVIFPAALAVAQDLDVDGKTFLAACVVGYEVGCRTGEFLGKSHYERFHTTATGGVLGAAAAAGNLLKLSPAQMLSGLGTAGTQAAGLWQFLLDASHSKQVHPAKACFDGIFAAYTAASGLLGPGDILEGSKGMGFALVPTGETNPEAINQGLGTSFAILETSFKWHASCRHTHPSVDALLSLMKKNHIKFEDIKTVVTRTYQAAINVLGLGERAETVHQSKFSMGFVVAVAAKYGQAMITDFTEEALQDPELREFQKIVTMKFDPELEARFPRNLQGIVEVTTREGQTYLEFAEVLKGDPEKTLTREELETKTLALTKYSKVKDIDHVKHTIQRAWNLEKETHLYGFQFS